MEKLVIADVGATGGPEVRWKLWDKGITFYTFDPDPRAEGWSHNFPIGLWSKRCKKKLKLAAYPPATSLFAMDREATAPFLSNGALACVGEEEVELDRLDEVLQEKIDFLKIDAEGAELEILKGAEEKLAHCLGFQVEIYFHKIRKGIPSFGDFERLAQKGGFQLFHLEREHWIRKNQMCGFHSAPQLIWGNALFLLTKEELLKRGPEAVAKYCQILLAYQMHDYAYELADEVAFEGAEEIKKLIASQIKKESIGKIVLSLFVGVVRYGFARKRKRHRLCYLKRKIRELAQACLFLARNDYALYDG